MNTTLSSEQINFYRTNGYVIIEDFLNEAELEHWRQAVTQAIKIQMG